MIKRIGMVQAENRGFPPDIRIEKEARSLIKAGFKVSLLVQTAGAKQAYRERFDYGLEVFRFNNKEQNLVQRWVENGTMFYRNWFKSIQHFVQIAHLDILHAHDLDIVPTTLKVAKKFSLPLVADLHENLPAAYVAYRQRDILNKLKNYIVRNYYLMRWHEKRSLMQCAKVIVVVPEATERLVDNYGISQEKICIVSNTEDESTFDVSLLDYEIINRYQDNWLALYIGGIAPHRGLDTAIRAAAQVAPTIPKFKLLVVGVQRDKERKKIMNLSRITGTSEYLELVDWVPSYKVNSYIAASDVCLVPHNDYEHTQTTVPHKLFQYMMMKKPVVVSSCRPLKRIVEETQSGIVFRVNDPSDLARCLVNLYRGGDVDAKKYGENGQKAALGSYSWKNDSKRLIKMYHNLFEL